MENELRHHLLICALAYIGARRLKLSTIGREVAGDSRFFLRLQRDGEATFTVRKYDAVVAWFADHWPPDLPWPSEVPRPAVVNGPVGADAAGAPPAPAAFSEPMEAAE